MPDLISRSNPSPAPVRGCPQEARFSTQGDVALPQRPDESPQARLLQSLLEMLERWRRPAVVVACLFLLSFFDMPSAAGQSQLGARRKTFDHSVKRPERSSAVRPAALCWTSSSGSTGRVFLRVKSISARPPTCGGRSAHARRPTIYRSRASQAARPGSGFRTRPPAAVLDYEITADGCREPFAEGDSAAPRGSSAAAGSRIPIAARTVEREIPRGAGAAPADESRRRVQRWRPHQGPRRDSLRCGRQTGARGCCGDITITVSEGEVIASSRDRRREGGFLLRRCRAAANTIRCRSANGPSQKSRGVRSSTTTRISSGTPIPVTHPPRSNPTQQSCRRRAGLASTSNITACTDRRTLRASGRPNLMAASG